MGTLPKWLIKASAMWVLIGTLAIGFGSSGIGIPEWVPKLFSQTFIDALFIAAGAVINFYQIVRTILGLSKPDTGVQALSFGSKLKYLNPFKVV